jgi:CheY-like chemotaxis protein
VQVIINLAVNARDAMPNGGTLSIRTRNVSERESLKLSGSGVAAGEYALVEVEDTGCGMTQEVMGKIFEPFFTTKDVGKGTGLGLSTSLAIVRSHGGFMRLDSAPGEGALFSVYLPAQAGSRQDPACAKAIDLPRGDGELILVVDDEAPVRMVTRRMLESFGYRVVLAPDGAQAVALYARQKDDIAAVITDMMMPVMDGPATIRALRSIRPDVRIIAASGLHGRDVMPSVEAPIFLAKPYSAEALLTSLRRLLAD